MDPTITVIAIMILLSTIRWKIKGILLSQEIIVCIVGI